MYDVIIIGGGPAGLTAAIYTGRAKLKTLLLESAMIGGNAALTDQIDNYPGFPFGINGIDLMENFKRQAERFDTQIRNEEVIKIETDGECKIIYTPSNQYHAKSVIIAVGAKRKELEVTGEKKYLGRGVSYCATCDGPFFHNAPVAVVGGGDTAVKEALFLADIASKVYLIHRREQFRANQTAMEKMLAHDKIQLLTNKIVTEIGGNEMLEFVNLQDTRDKAIHQLPLEGIFISIGLIAAADFLPPLIDTKEGYIVTDENMQTSLPGIFAAGDIRTKKARQVSTAVGDGALAGIAVIEYLKE